jgi:hypothetical protein
VFSKKYETLTRQYTPGLMDEVEAFAESAELEVKSFKAFLLTLGLEPGCSVVALGPQLTDTVFQCLVETMTGLSRSKTTLWRL